MSSAYSSIVYSLFLSRCLSLYPNSLTCALAAVTPPFGCYFWVFSWQAICHYWQKLLTFSVLLFDVFSALISYLVSLANSFRVSCRAVNVMFNLVQLINQKWLWCWPAWSISLSGSMTNPTAVRERYAKCLHRRSLFLLDVPSPDFSGFKLTHSHATYLYPYPIPCSAPLGVSHLNKDFNIHGWLRYCWQFLSVWIWMS